ncbi:hypothetical protein CRUP_003587 [Coryphaenoides rupestris]|nr:hypothetical protein CRUP_003587 [Coryphaenoides rupestris]
MDEDGGVYTGLPLKAMEGELVPGKRCGCCMASLALSHYKWKDVFTWRLLKTIAMGQALSLMICGTAANYAVVKAYQFTTLTSIQLLDCFVIPVLMVLSWFLLKTRYRPVHFVAVTVCLLGVGAMVGADLMAGRDQGSSSDVLLGDGLVLLSAGLYAVSNVCQEYTVKNHSRVEFLGMMGLFGTLISGIQLCMATVVRLTSATAVNLSLLTADLFSLFCGLFLFHYTVSHIIAK